MEAIAAAVEEFFGDKLKAHLWWHTTNPLLGSVTPQQMMQWHRHGKLCQWVAASLAENTKE